MSNRTDRAGAKALTRLRHCQRAHCYQRGAALVDSVIIIMCVGILAFSAYAIYGLSFIDALNALGAKMLGVEPPAPMAAPKDDAPPDSGGP